MAVRLTTVDERLQLAPGPSGRQAGVIDFDMVPDDTPRGGYVTAWLNRPYELGEVALTDHGFYATPPDPLIPPSAFQGYKFEIAPLPPSYSVGGVSIRSRERTYLAGSTKQGAMIPQQHEPVWAGFTIPQTGALRRGGKATHFFQMPDLNAPVAAETEKRLLRMRFTGIIVNVVFDIADVGPDAGVGAIYADNADATLQFRVRTAKVSGDGAVILITEQISGIVTPTAGAGILNKLSGGGDAAIVWGPVPPVPPVIGTVVLGTAAGLTMSGTVWASGHTNLAPGSILAYLPSDPVNHVLRDDGKGRLVGPDGDGWVDYVTGAYGLSFAVAEAGDVLVSYEYNCWYAPIDAHFAWDWMLV
jgi:hypothetical protein